MKRLIYPSTASAAAWWQENRNCHRADCFVINLPNGRMMQVTDGQWDVTIPEALSPTGEAISFSATAYGSWKRGKVVSEATFRCNAGTTDITCIPQPGTLFPGLEIGMLRAAWNHLFDGATVTIYTAYMPFGRYGTVQVVTTKWFGTVLKSAPTRGVITLDCADPFYLLNMKVPSRLMQSNCPWSFCDENCGLSAANYTLSFVARAVTQTTLTPATAFTQPDGYFAQGVVKCVSGANSGLSQTVKSQIGGVLTLMSPWILPVAVDDGFTVIKGCDKTPTTCEQTTRISGTTESQSFQQRFGGTPFVPPPTTAL
jgi:Phage conserved hypothetical protein BR0599/Uncharacterized conserved protein (DUF2163)